MIHRNTSEKFAKLVSEETHLATLLDKSLAIRHLWRSAFDYGDVRSRWIPNSDHQQPRRDALRDSEAHRGESLIITNGMQDVKKFPYDDVPQCLGGGKFLPTVAAGIE